MFGEGHSSCQVENRKGRGCAGNTWEGAADSEGELVTARAGLKGSGDSKEFRSPRRVEESGHLHCMDGQGRRGSRVRTHHERRRQGCGAQVQGSETEISQFSRSVMSDSL